MTKFNNPEIQSVLLDLYAMHGSDTTVARLSGVSRVTQWRMSKASEEGEPALQEVDWGGTIKPFHEHKLDALDMHIEDVQQRMTHDAGHGQWVPVVHSGEMRWQDDEYAVGLSPKEFEDALDLGIVWHDKKLRVLDQKTGVWRRVQVEQYIPPTLDAQSKVLSSFAPDVFGDKRKIDLNVSGGLGVTVIGQNRQPPQQVIDVLPSTVPAVEYHDAEPVAYTEPAQPQPVEAEQPVVVLEEPFTPDPNSPLTEEQQRILARSRSANGLAADLAARALRKQTEAAAPVTAKPFQPPPTQFKSDDQDDDVPRVPYGMKVV